MPTLRPEKFFDWVSRFSDSIQFIIFIVIAVSYFLSIKPLIENISFSSLAIASVLFLLTILIIIRIRKKYILYPRPQSDFKLLEKELVYKYLDEKHMKYIKRVKLKTLKEGLDRYPDRYSWTGSGKVQLKPSNSEQTIVKTVKKRVWQLYDVHFERPLNKGDVQEVEITWDLYDEKGTSVPFASMIVDESLDLLTMKIILPPNLTPQKASCIKTPSFGLSQPTSSFTKPFSRGEVEWTVKSPKLWYTYEIAWHLLGK